ncbi:MAG: sensor domain-containing diguanylate cyclase [Blastocatellia bacterium]|nr:sensor domain-containing diguanylate cyclase [Blastocatellia bacterium]
MNTALVFRKESPSELVLRLKRLLEASLDLQLLDYKDLEGFLTNNDGFTFLLCEVDEQKGDEEILASISQILNSASIHSLSFSNSSSSEFEKRSASLGFFAHFDSSVTEREIALHLKHARVLQEKFLEIVCQKKLISAVTELHFCLDRSKIIDSALQYLLQLTPSDSIAIFLASEENELVFAGGINPVSTHPLKLIDNFDSSSNTTMQDSFILRAALDGKSFIVAGEELEKVPRYSGYRLQSLVCVPLYLQLKLFGVIELLTTTGRPAFTEKHLKQVEWLALSCSAAVSNADSLSHAEELCNIDDLTQAYNSRYLHQSLDSEMKRSRRYKAPLSIIFIDLDGFKAINDTKGHLCGSATLTEVAKLMTGLVRETDIVARYGGDEFVIVLPETPVQRALMTAERIRKQIETHAFRGGGDNQIYLTASFGVASYPEHASSPAALIRCADKAMYKAKESNKNKVVLAS